MNSLILDKIAIALMAAPLALLIFCQSFPATAAERTESALTEEESRLKAFGDAVRKHYTIHHGGFRKFRTGQTREEVFEALGRMNIPWIRVRLDPQPMVKTPEDIHLLRNAEAIVIDDFVVVEFSGDEVTIFRSPMGVGRCIKHDGAWKRPERREDVLDFVRRYLKACPDSYALSTAKKPSSFSISDGLNQRNSRLLSYPGWSFNMTDGEGWWHLILWFKDDKLDEIEISFSPVELP